MTFDNDRLTVDSARGQDDELFTTPSTDPTPDRHPSVLRPGGHSSPLKHPSALRPGAARHSRTPSPSSAPTSPPPVHPPRASPSPVAYKAYSPPRQQSPTEELSSEIEGYFTALEVPPLHITRTPSPSSAVANPPLPPKEKHEESIPLEQRPASPPVPPKERIPAEEDRHAVSPFSELEAPTGRVSPEHVVSPLSEPAHHNDEEEAPPPPYEESSSVPPPPEKTAPSPRANTGSPAGAAAASAAHVGGAMAGVPVNEAIASSSAALAAVTIEDSQATSNTPQTGHDHDDIYSADPPPLPPRPTPSPTGKGKGKDPAMPGAFPPPPSQPSPGYKASGAAATSAAGVGGSIAGVGQSAGLKQARKALEKGLGHLIDKAKEHHHAREQQHVQERKGSGRKKSPDGGRKKSVENSGNVAQVSSAHSGLGLGVDADLYY